jgi:hypothetical protein
VRAVNELRSWGLGSCIVLAGCATVAPQGKPVKAVAETAVDEKPRPPQDLDAQLALHYPLRGLVLRENGMARVPFTVDASGAVKTEPALFATGPAYAAACRQMLEESHWTPARSAGSAVAFTSNFDCRFEHGGATLTRNVAPPLIAVPPAPPDYGPNWWDRYGVTFVKNDITAQLRITVGSEGRVRVESAVDGSDPELAAVCTKLLQEGPAWRPAKDPDGNPVTYRGTFKCVLDVQGAFADATLVTKAIGASGPLPPEQAAGMIADRFQDVVACFKQGLQVTTRAFGLHWLAFEVLPQGEIGRVEWLERPTKDPISSACVTAAMRTLRFPAAPERSIVDVQLYLGSDPD